jgi:hypothetical protein
MQRSVLRMIVGQLEEERSLLEHFSFLYDLAAIPRSDVPKAEEWDQVVDWLKAVCE